MLTIQRMALVASVLVLAACGHDDSDMSIAGGETVRLAQGDARITSRDGAIDLMLLGERIVVGLSDSVLREIRDKTDTSQLESDGGIGASIERFVKSKVQTTLAKRVEYPLSDIRDARYEKGRIVFDYVDGARFAMLENAESDNAPVLASFSEADSERFVEAVRQRLDRTRTASK